MVISKSKTVLFAAFATVIFMFSSSVFAQNMGGGLKGKGMQGAKFIDADGDGICDNQGTGGMGMKSGAHGKGMMGKNRANGMDQGLKARGNCQGSGLMQGAGTGMGEGMGMKGRMGGRGK
ncbi:MAG: hypothetical protein ACM3Q2_12290 [Syntrophothermus sp.]